MNDTKSKPKSNKLPAFQFYPGDWFKDQDLRRCSLAARGLWIDLLCYMWQCPERGVLNWSDEDLGHAFGNVTLALQLVTELISKGVTERDSRGYLISRRMVRDEQERQQTRARVNKFRKLSNRCNADVTGDVTGDVTPMKHASSFSSSTSTTDNTITPPVSPKGDLKKFGEKFLSMTEAQMKKCLEKYGKPLVDQELPNADEWIAESDTPNGRKYRKPGYNHYLFFSSTWMKSKRLEGNQPKLFKKPTTFDLNKGIIEELKEYDAGRKTEGMQAAIGIHLPAIPKGNH